MQQLAGSLGIIGVLIIAVIFVVVAILGFLMPIFVYLINKKMTKLRNDIKQLYTLGFNMTNSLPNDEYLGELMTEIKQEQERTNALLENFLSRLE